MFSTIGSFFAAEWHKRPWWMNLMFLFCLYMTIIYLPFDLFYKPVAGDVEVWFGYSFHNEWAKVMAVPHWIVYGAGAYGFFRMTKWMHPLALLYVLQIAFSMLVWNLIAPNGAGLLPGLIAMAVFIVPALALWFGRRHFQGG